MVEVIKAPIETKIIEEVKPPPPPPPENLPPPPKMAPPPPSFVPPPEVQIANPPPAPAITVTREAPPPAPPVALAPPPAPTAPPAPVAPRVAVAAQINVNACDKPEYPAAATRAEATGVTKIRFTVDAAGKVSKAEVEKASGASREHRLLDRAAVEALSKCPFKPGTDETGKPVGATTVVEYHWKLE
ncbi:energy transducer TonB [Aquincola sp. S2]|uniref:Energy transducer TonB n=1 Tax=Pseudaquabacterium terrae TaxID=2732868 RepID=A0ABX2EQG8_9BURK|nr:energy transducer TonB [Aquabacterium terrae]